MLLKKGLNPRRRLLPTPQKNLGTCSSPALEPLPSSAPPAVQTYDELCFSLADSLIRRGLLPLAQGVIHRIVKKSPTVSDAFSALEFARARGLELDSCGYGVLMRKLMSMDEYKFAEVVYRESVTARRIIPDSEMLNSMVICYCKLGNLGEAMLHFDRIFEVDYFPCRAACHALLRELCARKRFLDAFDCFKRANDVGILLGYWWANRLFDGLCYRGYLDRARYVFDTMRARTGLPPTIHSYKTLFYGLCRLGKAAEAELLVREMESEGHYMDKKMYTSLIYGYCKGKNMKAAMRVFGKMQIMGHDPDTYICNNLIRGLMKPEEAVKLLDLMVMLGLQRNDVTYHFIIRILCEREVDSALEFLNRMINSNLTPSVHSYTVLINALCKENRLEEAEQLYKKMLDSGVIPDHVLFFTLMKKLPVEGDKLSLAPTMLRAIAKNGCDLDLSASSADATHSSVEQEIECMLGEIVRRKFALADVAFGIVISALCAVGNTNAAWRFMEEMGTLGCRPLLSIYNSLIKCLFKEGRFEDAKSLIDRMEEDDLVPDLATYLIMVHEYCNNGDLGSACDILDKMKERGLKPSVAIYDCIIGCQSRTKKIYAAEKEFNRMLEAGVDRDDIIYATMISGCSKNGRAIKAMQLIDEMKEHGLQPSLHSYTAVISGLVKKNMITDACKYLYRIVKDGFEPHTVLCTTLIKLFLQKGDVKFAIILFNWMEINHIYRDKITYITFAHGVCRNINRRRWSYGTSKSMRARMKLLKYLNKSLGQQGNNRQSYKIPHRSVPYGSYYRMQQFLLDLLQETLNKCPSSMRNLYLYNIIISGFCRANMIQVAYDYFELMQRRGMHPNHVTFTILINEHIRFGEINQAVGLYNKMNANGCVPDGITNSLVKRFCRAGQLLDAP